MALAYHSRIIIVLQLFALCIVTAQSVGKITTYLGQDCKSTINGTFQSIELSNCQHFSYAVQTLQVTSELCAVTIYTDLYCSNNAAIANLNTCYHGLSVQSWTVDCPDPVVVSSAAPSSSLQAATSFSASSIRPASSVATPTSSTKVASPVTSQQPSSSVVPMPVPALSSSTPAPISTTLGTATSSLSSISSSTQTSSPSSTPAAASTAKDRPSSSTLIPIVCSLVGGIAGITTIATALYKLRKWIRKRRLRRRQQAVDMEMLATA